MKNISNIVAALFGLVFINFGLNFFLQFIPMPPPPEGSPPAMFMGAMYATGYLTFVKVLEIVGGILVAIPKTRILGLLVLGPIVVNILAFHVFLTGGAGLVGLPLVLGIVAATLLWRDRANVFGLVERSA